jgi:hypothetical protein
MLFPAGPRNLSFFHNVRTGSEAHPASCNNGCQKLFHSTVQRRVVLNDVDEQCGLLLVVVPFGLFPFIGGCLSDCRVLSKGSSPFSF